MDEITELHGKRVIFARGAKYAVHCESGSDFKENDNFFCICSQL